MRSAACISPHGNRRKQRDGLLDVLTAGFDEFRIEPKSADAITPYWRDSAGEPMTTDAGKFPGAINWTELGAKFSDDPAFIADLLHVVIASNAEAPALLRSAARAGDLEQIARLAHRTKGVAGDLVAPTCHAIACEVEAAARAGRTEAADLARRLADSLEAVLAEARARVGR
jgi:HPt (histidine-containing phosphotransfer) domain-containing protein